MQTPLGYSSAGLACVSVKATTSQGLTIPRGAVVSLDLSAAATVIGEEQTVIKVLQANGSTNVYYCGIALSPMGNGQGGTICMMGMCDVQVASPLPSYSQAVGIDPASPDDWYYLTATNGVIGAVKYGVALETYHASLTGPDYGSNSTSYANCWVNFIVSASFGYT